MTNAQLTSPGLRSTTFTLDEVKDALVKAGDHPATTDADIRRLSTVHIHMVKNDLSTIDNECLDDEQTFRLLDFYTAAK